MTKWIFYFKYNDLYELIQSFLHIHDVTTFLLTTYCGDVINIFTCPSEEVKQCIRKNTQHLPPTCSVKNCKNRNYIFNVCDELCVHYPVYCDHCSDDVCDESENDYLYMGNCLTCLFFHGGKGYFNCENIEDCQYLTQDLVKIGFKYQLKLKSPEPEYNILEESEKPDYWSDDDYNSICIAQEAFETGRELARSIKHKLKL